jgi:hypothetical protein
VSELPCFIWTRHVREAVAVKGPARAVLYAIADRADVRDGTTWVGQPQIAKDCGFCVRVVRDAMHELVAGGYLAIEPRVGTSAVLRLTIGKDGQPTGVASPARTPAPDAAPPAPRAGPAGRAGGTGRTCRGGRQDVPGGPAGRADEGPMKDPTKDPSKEQQRPARVPLPPPPASPDSGDAAHRLVERWRDHRGLDDVDFESQVLIARLVAEEGELGAELLIRWFIECPDPDAERRRRQPSHLHALRFLVKDRVPLLRRARAWAPPPAAPHRPTLLQELDGRDAVETWARVVAWVRDRDGVDAAFFDVLLKPVTAIGWSAADRRLVLGGDRYALQLLRDQFGHLVDAAVLQLLGPDTWADWLEVAPEPPALRVLSGGAGT